MTTITYTDIAVEISNIFWINEWIAQSWIEKAQLKTKKESIEFFKKEQDTINAQPFIKWVWGKRQLINQFKDLFPKWADFKNYHEPFLWWWAVFLIFKRNKVF